MKFQPKTKEEIVLSNLWEKGEYSFEILECDEGKDKNENDMLKLKVRVFKDNGQSQNIFDYVSGAWMEHKLRHLAEACGLLQDYETGELDAYAFVGKTGYCKVGVSIDKTGQYDPKNNIVDYLVDKPASKSTLAEVTKDDSIPF